jgi:protein-L-isoaspartate(D-aspartate) O-methyltransferase
MVQQLQVRPHHRILDIGAGSGYQTAILARMAGHVYAVERLDELAQQAAARLAELGITNVSFAVQDGSGGWAEEAPFDGLIAGAAAPTIPAIWQDQIVDGGRIVAPIGPMYSQELITIERHGRRWDRQSICGVRFVPLIGKHAWPEA